MDNRREFFNRFARGNGFDPRRAEDWYLQSKTKIMSTKVFEEREVEEMRGRGRGRGREGTANLSPNEICNYGMIFTNLIEQVHAGGKGNEGEGGKMIFSKYHDDHTLILFLIGSARSYVPPRRECG